MDSTSGADRIARTRIHQREVVELGREALETGDFDQLNASIAVAEPLDDESAKVLELLPDGGEIRIGSEPGEGTTVSVTLPAAGEDDE